MPAGRSDYELVEAAIAKAGGNAARLAGALGLQANTPNAWRVRLRKGGRLSLDKRRLLEAFVQGSPRSTVEAVNYEAELQRERERTRIEVLLELIGLMRGQLEAAIGSARDKALAAHARRQLRR